MLKVIRKNNGAALITVLMVFIVTSVLFFSVAFLTQTNIKQASNQEQRMQAYYLARSGAELGYEALLMESESLLQDFRNNTALYKEENGISFGEGVVDIRISSFDNHGEQWIRIHSTGKLNQSAVTNSIILEFSTVQPSQIKWSR